MSPVVFKREGERGALVRFKIWDLALLSGNERSTARSIRIADLELHVEDQILICFLRA